MDQTGLPARRAAHALLQRMLADGELLPGLIAAGALDHLAADDRARAQRLALETCRMLDRADRMLKPFLQKRPPLFVQNALRLGTLELVGGAAAHGVVNAYVALVSQDKRHASYKGLVNAVLRRVDGAGLAVWTALPVPVTPPWLRQPLVAAWGRKTVAALEKAHMMGAALDLTARADPAAVAAATGGVLCPNGTVRLTEAGQISQLPGYEEGAWWVQDAAAAMPVQLLAPAPGISVLDLCAAPGGKTMQLAAAGARVTAVDLSEHRMDRLKANLARTGLAAEVRVGNAFDVTQGGFDAVVLDAPCSATGTIRRHPELPHVKDGAGISELIAQQSALIDHALTLVRPGGTLVFCTCSLLPDEGEVQVEEALARHKGLSVWREALERPWVDPTWRTEEGGLRLRPDHWAEIGGMDGFYIALLRKPA